MNIHQYVRIFLISSFCFGSVVSSDDASLMPVEHQEYYILHEEDMLAQEQDVYQQGIFVEDVSSLNTTESTHAEQEVQQEASSDSENALQDARSSFVDIFIQDIIGATIVPGVCIGALTGCITAGVSGVLFDAVFNKDVLRAIHHLCSNNENIKFYVAAILSLGRFGLQCATRCRYEGMLRNRLVMLLQRYFNDMSVSFDAHMMNMAAYLGSIMGAVSCINNQRRSLNNKRPVVQVNHFDKGLSSLNDGPIIKEVVLCSW